MTTELKCPKCGAKFWKRGTIGKPCSIYDCGSWLEHDDSWQSDRCRIAQLEQENAKLRECLRSLRKPIQCAIFGIPEQEAILLLHSIDAALIKELAK